MAEAPDNLGVINATLDTRHRAYGSDLSTEASPSFLRMVRGRRKERKMPVKTEHTRPSAKIGHLHVDILE